jgi:TonB family protein
MPLALLLSPDDQAVSAITAVLEEMSVTCERPLDGVAAAKQLNSHNFDLVIVDCENLPAAKLIFDVCRRGTGGKSPIPIAIVNGRAGLPTAFRLGADLILTKPVAKDQARSTIRGAVNRVKKEQPASAGETAQLNITQTGTADAGLDSPQAQASSNEVAHSEAQIPAETQALAAAASSQGQSVHEAVTMSASASAVPTMSASTSASSEPDSASATKGTTGAEASTSGTTRQFSDDPVVAELERTEAGPEASSPAPIFSAYHQNEGKQSTTRGPLLALVALALVCSGLYAAWMTQPGFRTLVQPQVEQVLSLVGMAPHTQTSAPAPVRVKPVAPPAQASAPVSPVGSGPSAEAAATDATGSSASPTAATGTTTPQIAPSSPASNTAAQTPGVAASAANGTTASPATANHGNRTGSDKTVAAPNSGSQKSADAKNAETGPPSADTAVVLSSIGAEKRLIRSVPPSYPASARSSGVEGPVVLKAMVDENGKVSSAQVVQGNAALTEAAVNAVKQWRYRPYIRDGKVVPFQTVVQIDFPRP